ncbi:TlpA family protein disulfide reductase [Marinifilum flexuosum]|uniref:Cytochrome oxidase Cu insertion factor (SCO1/SenC/PrrC family) n=1 Tax=Marinifilum flexuosum TaxID=1117708 RepID=A0A419X3T7_9BACT|nr:TlpA disulfide reductase family protein [Marinifilum flexuosum]RKE02414.1 cytochrome oxidase Cu insertion factor (SCO1/SenC/PrrC family) [Marinifilum flexuosum]
MKLKNLKFLILLLLICSYGYSQNSSQEKAKKQYLKQLKYLQNKKAPNFCLSNKFGEEVKLEKFKNKVLVIDFWSTHCKPCIQDFPDLEKVKGILKDSTNIQFIGICIDTDKQRWKDMLDKYKLSGTQLFLDENSDTNANEFYFKKIKEFPTYLLISSSGIILGSLPFPTQHEFMACVIANGINNMNTAQSAEQIFDNPMIIKKYTQE